MTTTFYIDANRNNSSIKSSTHKNKWTYKLSNSIQIPQGSEIAVQDCFINKKGISGQTIEILEDIDETIQFTYYLSDNPHFVSRPNPCTDNKRAMTDSFVPLGTIYGSKYELVDNTLYDDLLTKQEFQERGQTYVWGCHNPNQRIDLFRKDKTATNFGWGYINGNAFQALSDPYNVGYSEQPMMAVSCSDSLQFTIPQGEFSPTGQSEQDFRTIPVLGKQKLFIPRGVYSVSEIADLIEGQINGKYVALTKNRYDLDNWRARMNAGIYEGTLDIKYINDDNSIDGNTIYRMTRAWQLLGDETNRLTAIGCVQNNPYAYSPLTEARQATRRPPKPSDDPLNDNTLSPTLINPDGKTVLGEPNYSGASFPKEYLVYYISVFRFNQIMETFKYTPEGYKYERQLDKSVPFTYDAQLDNSVDHVKSRNYVIKMSGWGVQSYYSGECDHILKQAEPSLIGTNPNRYWKRGDAQPGITSSPQGIDMNCPFGVHVIRKTNSFPDYFQFVTDPGDSQPSNMSVGLVTPEGLNKDNTRNGYYLGTPDFTFTYSTDTSSFQINNLHMNNRIPSVDMRGNKMDNEGQSVTYMKRHAERMIRDVVVKQTPSTDTDFFGLIQDRIRSALQQNSSRKGGVAVYNWAFETAQKLGDRDFDNEVVPGTNFKKFVSTADLNDPTKTPPALAGRRGFKFGEFFSSTQKAQDAWEKTLWFKLGFTYDNLQNEANWEQTKYYDKPNSYDNVDGLASMECEGLLPRDYILYGKTTDSDLDVSIAPTISNTADGVSFAYQEPPDPGKEPDKPAPAQIVRTYDNNDVYAPYIGYGSGLQCEGCIDLTGGGDLNAPTGGETYKMFINSFYRNVTCNPIQTSGKPIVATSLPKLSPHGYFLVTSNIVDTFSDEIKQQQPLPLLGVVPISNLSSQDFVVSKNSMIHTTQQPKILNSIDIEILYPDLTAPILEDGSSVILQITMPLPTPITNQPDMSNQSKTEQEKPKEDKKVVKQPDPRLKKKQDPNK